MRVQEKGDSMKKNRRLETNRMEKNYRLERKLTRIYGSSIRTRLWAAKHWWKFLNGWNRFPINEPKGFAEMAEYCYHRYWR